MKNKKWLLPAASLILAVLALIAYTLLQEEKTQYSCPPVSLSPRRASALKEQCEMDNSHIF